MIACPTPVHDDMGRMLATLLYVPIIQDPGGLGCTFARVRAIVEERFRGANSWWTWFWMRYYGNPFVHVAPLSRGEALRGCQHEAARPPGALDLVRDLVVERPRVNE